MMDWKTLENSIVSCARCPRLRAHCEKVAQEKKREFREWTYWGKPVAGFGDRHARLWIVGLAPAAHGANRTGRMFTGDSSGTWLYGALHRFGFASQAESTSRDDGLVLNDVFISNAGRCAPPDNKPTPAELAHCEPFLDAELALLERRRVTLVLGAIAFDAVWRLLGRNGRELPLKKASFRHAGEYEWGGHHVLASYHPSRQNTQTGRLTPEMWEAIFARTRALLDA